MLMSDHKESTETQARNLGFKVMQSKNKEIKRKAFKPEKDIITTYQGCFTIVLTVQRELWIYV